MDSLRRVRLTPLLAAFATRRASLRLLAVLLVGATGTDTAREAEAKPVDRVRHRAAKRRQRRRRRRRQRRSNRANDHRRGKRKNDKIGAPNVAVGVALGGSQVIPSRERSTVRFNEVNYEIPPGSFDLATSRFRAPITGIYNVDANLSWRGMFGQRLIQLVRNGSDILVAADTARTGEDTVSALTIVVVLHRGDSLEVVGWQDSGGPVEVYWGVMSIILVGQED